MLPNELRRRAIAAVAKLSIFAGATGCAGTVVVETETEPDTGVPADTEPGERPGPHIPVDPPAPQCSGITMNAQCCDAVLTATFADEAFWNDPVANATAQDAACCDLVLTLSDEWDGLGDFPVDPELTWPCCSTVANSFEEHPSCMAWGPPMPPRMRRTLRRRPLRAEVVA